MLYCCSGCSEHYRLEPDSIDIFLWLLYILYNLLHSSMLETSGDWCLGLSQNLWDKFLLCLTLNYSFSSSTPLSLSCPHLFLCFCSSSCFSPPNVTPHGVKFQEVTQHVGFALGQTPATAQPNMHVLFLTFLLPFRRFQQKPKPIHTCFHYLLVYLKYMLSRLPVFKYIGTSMLSLGVLSLSSHSSPIVWLSIMSPPLLLHSFLVINWLFLHWAAGPQGTPTVFLSWQMLRRTIKLLKFL